MIGHDYVIAQVIWADEDESGAGLRLPIVLFCHMSLANETLTT